MRPSEPPSAVISVPCQVKPFFIWMLTAPPIALRPNTGLPVTMSMRWIAEGGIRSNWTVSPKASLMRTPFW